MKWLVSIIALLVINGTSYACSPIGECRYNTGQRVWFYVVDGTDLKTPETGVGYADITSIGFIKEDASTGTFTLSADDCVTLTDGDWCEVDSTNSPGVYYFYEGTTTTFNTKGGFTYTYTAAGHKSQPYAMKVVSRYSWLIADLTGSAYCTITASTSGTSFTLGSGCVDHQQETITIATDSFVGSYLKAASSGATQCNVVGEGVFVSDMTSAGVVTVQTGDMAGSGFSATPSTTNCVVVVIP